MGSEGATVHHWSKDSATLGYGHVTITEKTGPSSGLPLSAGEATPRVPIYSTKPPQPPPEPPQGPPEQPGWKVKYPDYTTPLQRLASYVGWPWAAVGQDPRRLALCGFFYIGSADRARCFSCGTTLRNWEPGDDPHHEHLTWGPSCTFIHRVAPPTEEAIKALPDPPCPAPSDSSHAPSNSDPAPSDSSHAPSTSSPAPSNPSPAPVTVADSAVAKDASVVAKEAVVAQDNSSGTVKIMVQEATPPQASTAAMSDNGGSDAAVPMATPDVMNSPLVLAVLEMGVPEVKVREVISQRGHVFASAADLYVAAEEISVARD